MATTVGVIAAMGAAGGGILAQILATAPALSTGTDLAPWLQGGGSAAAVAGLVYFARMVVKGDLVARPVAQREAEAAVALRAAAESAARSLALADEAHARETVAAHVGNESIAALTRNAEVMRQVSEELRWWRERRPPGERPR